MLSSVLNAVFRSASPYRRAVYARYVSLLPAVFITGLLAGCGSSDDASRIGTRKWGIVDVAVEIRPSPPRAGHNEVVVIVSGEHHRPVFDAIVSLRAQSAAPWVQAIEDGHLGVYRRAVLFVPGPAASLQVRLQRADDQAVLEFPVTMSAQH